MATYVNDLRLKEIATGDESGTWGTSTNTNLELIAEAFSFGTEAITTNADTHTTTIADGSTDPGRSLFLKYTGTLDSTCTITIGPNTVSKLWFIENATSGSQSIIISQGSGANITILNGQTKAIYSDGAGSGAAMVDAFTDLSVPSFFVSGDLDVDGTTNLDVVDIDGALTQDGGAVFNEASADVDFRVESNGNTHMLFVDAGNDRVGIGISSPTTTLDVAGSVRLKTGATGTPVIVSTGGDSQGTLRFGSSGNEYSINSGADYVAMIFNTNGAERMRIDSSGNVTVKSAGELRIRDDGTFIKEDQGLQIGNTSGTGTSRPIRFFTESAERMRLLSNGTLLVGKTADDNTVGFKTNTDSTYMVASGQTPTFINRLSSDGDLLEFRKDSTAVGSIGALGTNLLIGNGDTGLRFAADNNAIHPWNTTSLGLRDAAIDLGADSIRFKDLYLSGGVYLGGTGSANYLDDYEEGTFTPSYGGTASDPTATYLSQTSGRYTKIGDLVHCQVEVRTSSISGGSGDLEIKGFPFTSSSLDQLAQGAVTFYNITFNTAYLYTFEMQENTTKGFVRISRSGTTSQNAAVADVLSSNPALIRFTVSYKVA